MPLIAGDIHSPASRGVRQDEANRSVSIRKRWTSDAPVRESMSEFQETSARICANCGRQIQKVVTAMPLSGSIFNERQSYVRMTMATHSIPRRMLRQRTIGAIEIWTSLRHHSINPSRPRYPSNTTCWHRALARRLHWHPSPASVAAAGSTVPEGSSRTK
jgi:hypothetical protein